MLSKANRLTRQKDFSSLFREAKSFQSRELVLKVFEKKGTGGVRAGVIISKKSAKKAVTRNRLKRLIREMLATFIPRFPIGTDLAVITRQGAEHMEETHILSSLHALLEKAVISHS